MEKHFNLIKMHHYYISNKHHSQYQNFKKVVKISIFLRKNNQLLWLFSIFLLNLRANLYF